jgi:hypothetical protein
MVIGVAGREHVKRGATTKVKPRLLCRKEWWHPDICDVTHKFLARSEVSHSQNRN